jgi:coenzyme F420-reducing hydrogenase delta subunit
MSSFINFNNKEVTTGASYTAEAVKIALLKSETKSSIKAETLTKNIKEPLSLNEALVFFTDKLSAMKSLSLANAEINEGKIKQFETDYKDMETSIKRGIGWIDPEYVADTWENSSDSIDFELVKTELYKRLIASGLLAFSNPDGETKGVPVRSLKDLSIKESLEADKVNETLFFAFFNNKKIEVEGKDLWDAKQKAIIELKVPKSKIGYLAVVSAESQKNQDFKFESFVNESEVETIELDMAWDEHSVEDDKAAKAAFKKYKIKVKGANGQPGTYEVTGKKKDILAYLKSDFYEMDQETIEEYYPELLESVKKPAGLTLDDTRKVAELYASALSKADGVKVTVNKKSLEEDSFDLDIDGEEYAGGSYNIYHNGEVVNHAVPGSPVYGYFDDKLDTIVKNIKNPKLHESAMSDIDIMAQEAKDFKSFVKEFKKEFKNMDAGSPKELEAWLQTIYDSAKENMDESVKSINEGQFSWMTQDTGNQIGSEKQNTIAVTMFDDKGNKWEEKSYDGYGEFGGKDYYELLAQMNGIENPNRQDGIDIAFDKKKVKGKVLFPALVEDPKRFNFKKHDFTQEAEHDPNQSWYQEEEYDDDYEEYDESKVTEAARVPSNILDFAKRKGSYATSLVKKAATWAEKAGKYISGGTAIGKDYMTIILDMKHQGSEIYINLNDETIELFGEEVTDAKSFQKVLDANMSESKVNESAADLIKYVETTSEKTFKGGGNGQNLLDNAMELASHIGDYEMGRPTRGYEEDGFYGPATVTLFKRLVDQMSADDIKNNQADKYESLDVNEHNFKVGDKVKMSHGGSGVIKSLDKESGADDEKYYNVELPNGEMHKHAPNELTKESVVIEGISVTDERVYGKKGIIIMIDDNGKIVSAIFKDKKNADKYNRNKAEDIKTLLDLAKNTKYPNAIDESIVNEGRSINKIQKEWSDTTTKMQQKAGEWKVAEGDRKSELLDEMKALTAKKRELEAELDAAVAGKDKDLELVVSEGNAFGAARAKAIADGAKEFEFEGETYKVEDVGADDKENAKEFVEEGNAFLAARAKAIEEDAEEFEFNGKTFPVIEEGNAFGAARAKAIADGAKEFEFEGETYKVEDVGADDKENAKEFVEESKLTLDALVEMFEVKVNEDLRSDVKKFIKANVDELNTLADKDEWDLMYAKLYNEFNVEANSTKGKDLLKTFQFVF